MQALEITRAEATKIILEAHANKRLSAQHGIGGTYYDPATQSSCAIGQLFTAEQAEALQARLYYPMAHHLIILGLLVVDDPTWFRTIQRKHDEWAAQALGDRQAPDAERDFLDLLK